MNKKTSGLCLAVGVVFLVAAYIASLYTMANEVYLIAAFFFLIESIVCFFSRKNIVLNSIVALIAYSVITASVCIGLYSYSPLAVVLIIACVILDRTLLKS